MTRHVRPAWPAWRGGMPALIRTRPPGLPAILSVAAALAAWEIYVRVSGISALVLPAPSAGDRPDRANRELLWANTLPTLQATLTGFAFSLTLPSRSRC
jgi:ABC-type nitrate/sulfonate/bicarbonate transport system permease component